MKILAPIAAISIILLAQPAEATVLGGLKRCALFPPRFCIWVYRMNKAPFYMSPGELTKEAACFAWNGREYDRLKGLFYHWWEVDPAAKGSP